LSEVLVWANAGGFACADGWFAEHVDTMESQKPSVPAEAKPGGLLSDPERWVALNDQFHLLLYQEAGSVRLLQVISTLRNWVAAYILNLVRDDLGRTRVDKDHLRIIDEVQKQNAAGLRAAIHQHLRNSCNAVIASLGRAEQQKKVAILAGRKPVRGKS